MFVCGKTNQGNGILSKASLRIHTQTQKKKKLHVWVPDSLPEEDLATAFCCANI